MLIIFQSFSSLVYEKGIGAPDYNHSNFIHSLNPLNAPARQMQGSVVFSTRDTGIKGFCGVTDASR